MSVKNATNSFEKIARAGVLALALLTPTFATSANEQETLSIAPPIRAIDRVNLQTLDTRGKGDLVGEVAANSASRNAVVLKVHGYDQMTIDRIEDYMKTLIMHGYERIGIVYGDGDPGRADVYSGGTYFKSIRDPGPDAATELAIRNIITQGYDRDIRP